MTKEADQNLNDVIQVKKELVFFVFDVSKSHCKNHRVNIKSSTGGGFKIIFYFNILDFSGSAVS